MKVNFSLHNIKAYRESRGIALLIFNLGTRWRWVVSCTHPPPYPQERTMVLINRRPSGAPEPVRTIRMPDGSLAPAGHNNNNNNNNNNNKLLKVWRMKNVQLPVPPVCPPGPDAAQFSLKTFLKLTVKNRTVLQQLWLP